MFKHKPKSISPLIATVLLIVVSVILVVVVLTWGKDFVGESLEETKIFYQESDLTGFVVSQGNINNFITVANNHKKQDANIIGYQIITSTEHILSEYFENKIYYLDNSIILSPNTSKTILIECFPERSFFINLISVDNKYIRLNINPTNYDPLKCFSEGLIGWWRFEGNANNFKKNNDGEVYGASLTTGVIDSAYYYDGFDNYIDLGTSEMFETQNLSISLWVKKKGSGSHNTGNMILSKGRHGSPPNYSYVIRHQENINAFGFYLSFTDNTRSELFANDVSVIDDFWYHLVATYDGEYTKFYVDGILRNYEEVSKEIKYNFTNKKIFVGKWGFSEAFERAFNGVIDELRIYDRALSENEINLLYKLEKSS